MQPKFILNKTGFTYDIEDDRATLSLYYKNNLVGRSCSDATGKELFIDVAGKDLNEEVIPITYYALGLPLARYLAGLYLGLHD